MVASSKWRLPAAAAGGVDKRWGGERRAVSRDCLWLRWKQGGGVEGQ